MQQSQCSIFALVTIVIMLGLLINSYRSTIEIEKQNIQMARTSEQLLAIVEKQNKLQDKNDQIQIENVSQIHKLSISINDLKKDFEYLSQLKLDKLDVEQINKELIKAQAGILMNENKINNEINSNAIAIGQIVTKVGEMEKEQRNLLLGESSLIAQVNQNSIQIVQIITKVDVLVNSQSNILINENNLTTSINSNSNKIDQMQAKVEEVEKELKNIAIIENSLSTQVNSSSIKIDSIQTKVDALEKDHRDILINENRLITQVNSTLNKIDQFKAEIDVLPVLSAKLDSLGLTVPQIQDSLDTLSSKINVDTFNKVELFGPYYPNQHSIPISVTNSGYKIFQTLEPCIISLQGKAIVTLIATGHAASHSQQAAQLSFMINSKADLPFTQLSKWQFGGQFVWVEWCPVNLTQEFMLEKGVYEFSLGGNYPDGSTTIYLNAVSFVAKVTYIS